MIEVVDNALLLLKNYIAAKNMHDPKMFFQAFAGRCPLSEIEPVVLDELHIENRTRQ